MPKWEIFIDISSLYKKQSCDSLIEIHISKLYQKHRQYEESKSEEYILNAIKQIATQIIICSIFL